MFTKVNNYKDQYSKKIISIGDLVDLVKNNPQKDLIQKIRELPYKGKEYNSLKSKINCITPHGTFNKIENDGLIKLSGYLYYDIDNFETENDLNETISKLINDFPICFLQRSVSNKGFHFFIKYDIQSVTKNIPNETFVHIHKYISNQLSLKGYKCDKNATGISRRMIISSDDNVIFNNVSLGINLVSVYDYINELNRSNILKVNNKSKKIYDTNPYETFMLIEEEELKKQINVKTQYEMNGDYLIEDKEYYFLVIPKVIKDGTKHSLYTRLINGLYYLNPNINRNQIYSFLYYVNNRALPRMKLDNLKRLINYICDNVESTGEIKIKTKTKKIHFNMESKLTTRDKKSIGAKINAILRKNKTITKIQEAKELLLKQNIEPKQVKVIEMTGLSKASVSRYWEAEIESIDNIETKETVLELPSIEEEQFFQETKDIVKHLYKGFEEVLIERSVQDKDTFKSVLKHIQNEFGDILESLVIETLTKQNWDKYKIDYYYSNWKNKQQVNNLF